MVYDPITFYNYFNGIQEIKKKLDTKNHMENFLANIASDLIIEHDLSKNPILSPMNRDLHVHCMNNIKKETLAMIDKLKEQFPDIGKKLDGNKPHGETMTELWSIYAKWHNYKGPGEPKYYNQVMDIINSTKSREQKYVALARIFKPLLEKDEANMPKYVVVIQTTDKDGNKQNVPVPITEEEKKQLEKRYKMMPINPSRRELKDAKNKILEKSATAEEAKEKLQATKDMLQRNPSISPDGIVELEIPDKELLPAFYNAKAEAVLVSIDFPRVPVRKGLEVSNKKWQFSDSLHNMDMKKTLMKKGINIPTVTTLTPKIIPKFISDTKQTKPLDLIVSVDSIAGYSPVVVKDENGDIDIIPIEELADFNSSKSTSDHKEITDTKYKIWVGHYHDESFKSIKFVARHPYNGELIQVNTVGGLIDTSPNHSLINSNGQIIDAKEVKVGDRLAVAQIRPPRNISDRDKGFFLGNNDIAWLFGFFAAEGSAWKRTNRVGGNVAISNKKLELLEKCKRIIYDNWGIEAKIYPADNCYSLVFYGKRAYNFFRTSFYNSRGEKKVPKSIFNAPFDIKYSFIRGYYTGDGTISGVNLENKEFHSFTTVSQTLAMGLLWLLKSVVPQYNWNITTRKDKLNVIDISIVNKTQKYRGFVKKVRTIEYEGYLYDIEVMDENHRFVTGVGGLKAKNTSGSTGYPSGGMNCEADYEMVLLFAILKMARKIDQKVGLSLWTTQLYYKQPPMEWKKFDELIKKAIFTRWNSGGTRMDLALKHAIDNPNEFHFVFTDGEVFYDGLTVEILKEQMKKLKGRVHFFLAATYHLEEFKQACGSDSVTDSSNLNKLPRIVLNKWRDIFWRK